jgi:hypothetical protein
MLAMGLFWIGVVLVVTAIFMLFLDSFQTKKIWAIISLLLILPLFVHMVLHWSSLNVRKSLYLLVIGVLALLVSVSGGALSQLSFLQDHKVVQKLEDKIAPPEDTPLPNQQQADTAALSVEDNYDPLLTGGEYEQLDTKEIVPEKTNQVLRKAEPSRRYELVTPDERIHAINKHVRIIMTDGSVVEGRLTEISDDSLIVESDVNGGSLGLSYKNDLIQSVSVSLMQDEKLYVPREVEEEQAQEPITGQPEVASEATLYNEVPEVNVDEAIEQEPILQEPESTQLIPEMVPAPLVQNENEMLEKVEEIVDDTELLNNVNGQ